LAKSSKKKHTPSADAAGPEPAVSSLRSAHQTTSIAAALAVLVFIIYAQVRTHSFINFDDPQYVTQNQHVMQGLTWYGVKWAFTNTEAANWHPLTWISHMIDVQFFGPDAGRHLLVSVALHAINSILVFLFLRLATAALWRSVVVAALFAVHPLHVESVAWISERKDTLSTLFFLLCLMAYTRYVQDHWRRFYVAAVAALAAGLMAKPMLITTPFVLLLLDFWPFRRFETRSVRNLLVEKLPFALCVVPSMVMTVVAQRGALSTTAAVPLLPRLANAAIAYVAYVRKTIWPSKLAVMYPLPTRIDPFSAAICVLLLAAATAVAYRYRRELPWLLFGWCWFIGTLIPVIGVVQVGIQSMADRYTYIPHIGLFVAMVWTVHYSAERVPGLRAMTRVAAAIIVLLLGGAAYAQVHYWRGNIPLFQHALAVTTNNKLAHFNLGGGFLEAGDYRAAEREYRQAEGFRPAEGVYIGLALALLRQEKVDAAADAARLALQANPNSADAAATLGTIELVRGRPGEAEPILARSVALRKDPLVMGRLSLARGQLEEAKRHFSAAVVQYPNLADGHCALANVVEKLGDDAVAVREYSEGIRLNPNLYDCRMNYGALLSRLGHDDDAAEQFAQSARIRPRSAEPHVYAGLVEANRHRFAEASREIELAMEADHDGSNRILIEAIRIPPRRTAIDEYLVFLRQQAPGR
jgi:tetratricopeptide (TPR) repeat protein